MPRIFAHEHNIILSLNKEVLGLKAQPLKDFILGSSPSVNRKLLTLILKLQI